MYLIEYAQFRNRFFAGWIDAGQRFPTRRQAEMEAASRGLVAEGDDHLISYEDTSVEYGVPFDLELV